MKELERGEVVLLAFPFTDLTTTKNRPAVVLSARVFNSSHQDIIVAAITSRLTAQESGDIKLTSPDQKQGGLLKPSIVKPGKIVTIDQRLIRKTIGHLPETTMHKIQVQLKALLIE